MPPSLHPAATRRTGGCRRRVPPLETMLGSPAVVGRGPSTGRNAVLGTGKGSAEWSAKATAGVRCRGVTLRTLAARRTVRTSNKSPKSTISSCAAGVRATSRPAIHPMRTRATEAWGEGTAGECACRGPGRGGTGPGRGGLGRLVCLAAEVEARHVLLKIVEHTLLHLHPIRPRWDARCLLTSRVVRTSTNNSARSAERRLQPAVLGVPGQAGVSGGTRSTRAGRGIRRYSEYPGRQGYPAVPRGCCGGRRGCGAVGGWRYGIIGAKDRLQ